jgi:membrane protein
MPGVEPITGMPQPPPVQPGAKLDPKDHTVRHIDPVRQTIWDYVSGSPLHNLWDFQGASAWVVMERTFKSFMEDNLLSRAAELGFYFLFALFPTLLFASSILGLVAKRADTFYVALLHYLAIVIPHSAFQMVMETFNQTTQAATGGKITFGLAAALWSASVGFAAIQDTANTVYKVKETRPYWLAKGQAILVTLLLSLVVSVTLAVLLGADYIVKLVHLTGTRHFLVVSEVVAVEAFAWVVVLAMLMLIFALIYYYAPDVKNHCWNWLSPGAAVGIAGWFAASIGLRVYLHYFNSFSETYGSLGAVIILLTWFYITGLMLLTGAEINAEIQAAVAEKKLKESGVLPVEATTDAAHPVVVDPSPAA